MDVISLAGRQSETSCRTSCWGWERRASYEVQHLAREGAGETRGFVGQCVEGLCGGDVVGGTIDEGAYGPYLAAFSGNERLGQYLAHDFDDDDGGDGGQDGGSENG